MTQDHPQTAQTIHVESGGTRQLYEGEARMSQEQQDYYKSLLGDGHAKITVSREVSEADYGSGGKVFVAVTLTCDQSQDTVGKAIALAHQVADGAVWHYHTELKNQLRTKGILK